MCALTGLWPGEQSCLEELSCVKRWRQRESSPIHLKALVALAASVIERRRPRLFPLLTLLRDWFPSPPGIARGVALALFAGVATVARPSRCEGVAESASRSPNH